MAHIPPADWLYCLSKTIEMQGNIDLKMHICLALQWMLGGARPCCTHGTVLISPTIPAATSKCPTLVLAAPTTNGLSRSLNTCANAPTSCGSPNGVPVP